MRRPIAFLLVAAVIASMGGCEFQCRSEPEGTGEKIGEAVDKAVRDIKDSDGKTEVKIKVKETPKTMIAIVSRRATK